MALLSAETIARIKEENPLDVLIGARVKLGRANSKGVCSGPCLCNATKGKTPLWVNGDKGTFGCLKSSGCGGDIFSFLEQFDGLDFAGAVKSLLGGEAVRDEATVAEFREKRAAEKAARRALEAELDEQERARAFEIWQNGVGAAGTLVDAYFAWRGLTPLLSPSLRYSAAEPFYIAGEKKNDPPRIIHRGPCMLAAIQGIDGRFCGLHRTWLDPHLADGVDCTVSGKAHILLPDGTPADVKKMRGAKKRGAIRLRDCPADAAAFERVLVMGEGIETTATGLEALIRHGRAGVLYFAWAAGDLGNISGLGAGPSTPHPTHPKRWVPSPDPDMAEPGVVPPPYATRVILLGDGDSDPVITRARLECGKRRFQQLGFPTAIRMAPATLDFNDLARSAQ